MNLVILCSIVVLCISDYVNASCNQCGVNSNVACFSNTQYFNCNAAKEVDISVLLQCVSGFCTDANPPCSGGTPDCQIIVPLAPSPTTTMAPVTPTTTMAPVTITTTMAPGTTTATTTTTAVVTITSATATAWCQTKAPGRYAQPGDKTCSNYVYCYLNGGIMGWVYSCVGTTLFNPTTSSCQVGHTCV